MGPISYHEVAHYRNSIKSGSYFESSVVELIKHYTGDVWHNVRIETLLAQTGTTELDVIFYSSGIVYILELKRVRKIVGRYAHRRWTFYRWLVNIDEASEYTVLNTIEQNNIHARSLSDLYFSEFRCFPTIVPLVIVPDTCEIPAEIGSDVITVRELEETVLASHSSINQEVAYRLAFLLGNSKDIVRRNDFVDRNVVGDSVIRGRRRI